jgi:putative transcriptional regulator
MPVKEGAMAKVQARLDTDGTLQTRPRSGRWRRAQPRTNWPRVDATTEAELVRQAAADDAEAATEAAAWARRVRRRTRLSQTEFARRIGIPLATVRDWERGKDFPEGAARSLLRVIDRMPEAALAALAA